MEAHAGNIIKPRPNMWTQHIPTLLASAQNCERNMLRAFGHPVARCYDILGIENRIKRMPGCNIVARTWPNDHNIMQHPQMLHEKKMTIFKFELTGNTQHVATPPNTSLQGGQTRAKRCVENVIVWTELRVKCHLHLKTSHNSLSCWARDHQSTYFDNLLLQASPSPITRIPKW